MDKLQREKNKIKSEAKKIKKEIKQNYKIGINYYKDVEKHEN